MTSMEFDDKLLNIKEGLQSFAYSLTNDRSEAEDLLQETFLRVLVNKDKFQENTNLKAWAYTIMRNTFINNYRRMVRINTIVDRTDDEFFINTSTRSYFGIPQSDYSFKEITKVIKNIDDDQRIPFELQYQGYKYKEIAEQLNLSIGTVKSRIFFCRRKLMDALKEQR